MSYFNRLKQHAITQVAKSEKSHRAGDKVILKGDCMNQTSAAHDASMSANQQTGPQPVEPMNYGAAAKAHMDAAKAHMVADKAHKEEGKKYVQSAPTVAQAHFQQARSHFDSAQRHESQARDMQDAKDSQYK